MEKIINIEKQLDKAIAEVIENYEKQDEREKEPYELCIKELEARYIIGKEF